MSFGTTNRRSFITRTATIIAAATGLAGCSGQQNSGTNGEVIENDYDNITIESSRLENDEGALGNKIVRTHATLNNTGNEPIKAGFSVRFLNEEGNIIQPDGPDEIATIPPDKTVKFEVTHQGRKQEVAKYEMLIDNPDRID